MVNTEIEGQAPLGMVAHVAGTPLFDPWLATNTKLPVLSMAMAVGFAPVGAGTEGGVVPLLAGRVATARAPERAFSVYCETPPGPMPPAESMM